MITPTLASEHRPPSLPSSVSPAPDREVWGDDSSVFLRQLAVIPGMLSTLDSLTTAGQRHMMGKVVSFMEDHAERAVRSLSFRNQRMFADLLGHLARESKRLLPDTRSFSHRAESLLALLAAIA